MAKRISIVFLVSIIALYAAGMAVSAELQGKVVDVKGKTVTIEINKGKASDLSKGDTVEIKSEEKKATPPRRGQDMLMGC
ncbi:hypothetical protein Selin_2599 [Desulfurispirillum indicum S5]|uniref:Uncharacterized protein n=2 Tax=Desulfurispirillum TaxID=393029 RepID=E6W6H5_DESIS|nr:hypothetical protein Selin_2599 [Desulfurispirillum indicum S5]